MNEEKKLPDEAVEDVAGGATEREFIDFIRRNCGQCLNRPNCPYGRPLSAFKQLGVALCPDFAGTRRPHLPNPETLM